MIVCFCFLTEKSEPKTHNWDIYRLQQNIIQFYQLGLTEQTSRCKSFYLLIYFHHFSSIGFKKLQMPCIEMQTEIPSLSEMPIDLVSWCQWLLQRRNGFARPLFLQWCICHQV